MFWNTAEEADVDSSVSQVYVVPQHPCFTETWASGSTPTFWGASEEGHAPTFLCIIPLCWNQGFEISGMAFGLFVVHVKWQDRGAGCKEGKPPKESSTQLMGGRLVSSIDEG